VQVLNTVGGFFPFGKRNALLSDAPVVHGVAMDIPQPKSTPFYRTLYFLPADWTGHANLA
jgi:hypothetical protein